MIDGIQRFEVRFYIIPRYLMVCQPIKKQKCDKDSVIKTNNVVYYTILADEIHRLQ